MPVSTYAALLAKLANPTQEIREGCLVSDPTIGSGGPAYVSTWATASHLPSTGVVPTTAAIPDHTFAGSLQQFNKAGTDQRAWLRRFDAAFNTGQSSTGLILLVDRLAHIGGLNATTTTPQTVAFPALTRFTSGVGVWAAAEIYTAIGATGTTLTISYTNTVPTAGQTSSAITFGGAGWNSAQRILPISLEAGDLGVTAVASATVLATTGTAGNFGVTLYKTLDAWPIQAMVPALFTGAPLPTFGGMPSIPDGACLQLIQLLPGGVANQYHSAVVDFFED